MNVAQPERSIATRNMFFFFFKQKTAYEIVSGDWSSDVCSSDLSSEIRRLLAGDMTNRVERINPQIQQRATATESLCKSPCARSLLPEEATMQRFQLPELARLDDPDRLLPQWLVVHAVADHQFDLGLPAGIDHFVAFGARNGHRLLA